MSNRRRQRRAKQVRRTNQRAQVRRRRAPTTEEIARNLLLHYAPYIAEVTEQVEVEVVVGELVEPMWEELLEASHVDIADEMSAPALVLTRMLATQADATDPAIRDTCLALALMLRGTSRMFDDVHTEAAALVDALRTAGATDPPWAANAGGYEPEACWVLRDPWYIHVDVLVGWREPGGARHTIVASSDWETMHQLTGLHVDDPIDDVVAQLIELRQERGEQEEALTVIEEVSPKHVAGMLDEMIAATWHERGEALSGSDGVAMLHVLLHRYQLLLQSCGIDDALADWSRWPLASELDELTHDELMQRFVASPQWSAEPDASEQEAELLVDWFADLDIDWRAQFGPPQVAIFVKVGAHGVATELRDDADALHARHRAMLATMRAWARFTATYAGTSERATEIVSEAIDAAADALLGSMRGDGFGIAPGPGMADRFVQAMLNDGVDIEDEEQVTTWVERYNASLDSEPDTLIDGGR